MATEVTVGVDIGTTSVKALAVDGDGTVVARTRVPHELRVPASDRLEHDIDEAWREGVRAAYADVSQDLDVRAANVAAMVPSLGAVDADGHGVGPGLLYGDARGRAPDGGDASSPHESGELYNFLKWLVASCSTATGFWPAQATANHALCGRAGLDSVTAMTAIPLFDFVGWDAALAEAAGTSPAALPAVIPGAEAVGRITGTDVLLGGGGIDAFGEQLVAGADNDGDVLVICGTTLITWAVIPEWVEVPGLWTIPHTAPGKILIGGPSNAGGLFLDWARRLAGDGDEAVDPGRVPVWMPYVRGERTPLHDPDRRAALHDLDLTHGPAAVRRAAFEAAGFVVRHHLDLAGVHAHRIVATGGGVRVDAWVQALADCTGLPVDVVAVPEGGALGAAFMARVTAGLEASSNDAARWARTERRVEPDAAWSAPVADRYARFRELTG